MYIILLSGLKYTAHKTINLVFKYWILFLYFINYTRNIFFSYIASMFHK